MNIEHKQKMVSLLYYLAMSDGTYQKEEQDLINGFIKKHSLPPFKLEPDYLPALIQGFTSQEKRSIAEELNLLMRADGIITPQETAFFAKVNQFLG